MKSRYLLYGALLLVLALALAACSQAPAPTEPPTPCPTAPPCPDCPAPPEPPPCPEPVVKDVPFEAQWAGSPHNDSEGEPFIHWNEDDPKEVPVDCARCHSTPGYQDYVGADGSPAGVVDKPAPIGTTVQCVACHNAATATLSSVTFPSGAVVSGLGREARCMVCHQGRASGVQVDEAIAQNGLAEDLDTANPELGFINIHYFATAATLYGTQTKGGYQYAGKAYDGKNDHVAGYDTCIGCHNPHTLERKVDECKVCHTNVSTEEDLRNIRMRGSLVDYDGDGDVSEGISFEIDGLEEILLQAIQAYGTDVAGTAIAYDVNTYPYFFVDTNADGTTGADEAVFANAYKSWTGRLLRAAYNYQTSVKDPGAYAHGGKYIIQLLYDSIEDLNSVIASPVDLSKANRIDAGHFAGSEEAFRHWDAEEEEPLVVPATCSKCHTGAGLPFLLENGVIIKQHAVNGLNCATCHNDLSAFTRHDVGEVTFPSGAKLDTGSPDANLCINCHQGRESTTSVTRLTTGLSEDVVAEGLTVRNPHYFAAGATLFGDDAKGAYQYPNKEYRGRNAHVEPFDTCVECHDTHALTVKVEGCANCHAGVAGVEDLQNVRMDNPPVDYDGDGNTTEGIAGEIATLHEALYAAIQAYATDKIGTSIIYNGANYPYFFIDTNGDGVTDEAEVNADNRYTTLTPRLLKATYNYLWVAKDPGAFAHNGKYILEILYDSLADIGGSAATAGMTRP